MKGIKARFQSGSSFHDGTLHGEESGTQITINMNSISSLDFWTEDQWGIVGMQATYADDRQSPLCGGKLGQNLHIDIQSDFTSRNISLL